MFAINHAATALVLKRAYPGTSLVWLLVSVQLMEFVWVILNYIGVEQTTTEAAVTTVADIHLAHMPYSHSILTILGVAVVACLVLRGAMGRRQLGLAFGLGIASHLVLDLLTHQPDIALAPGFSGLKFGLGLYAAAPLVAFALELGYGILCWWIFRGGRALLAVIVFFNLANLSMFSAAIPGPEQFLANRPGLLTTVILLQIVVTLVLIGYFASREPRSAQRSRTGPIHAASAGVP